MTSLAAWPIARARIVSVVEGTAVSSKGHGLGDGFKHDKNAGGDKPVSAERRFWLEWRGARRRGPAQRVAAFVVYDVVLVVEYKLLKDRAALDVALGEDYEALSLKLQVPSSWQPAATTKIRLLGAGDGDAVFPATVVDVFSGGEVAGKRLQMPFACEVET